MKILVAVDMQNDFIDGALGTKEAAAIVDNAGRLIDRYLKKGDLVLYTRDTHTEDYLKTQEGRNLPVVHCVKGTPGWEISEKVYRENCPVVDKPSFGSTALPEELLKAAARKEKKNWTDEKEMPGLMNSIEKITLIGLCTDICVISNALILKAYFPEIPIEVDASCCAGVTPESHRNALKAMQMCQIKILHASEDAESEER